MAAVLNALFCQIWPPPSGSIIPNFPDAEVGGGGASGGGDATPCNTPVNGVLIPCNTVQSATVPCYAGQSFTYIVTDNTMTTPPPP
jgi:hypothetical protein